MCPSFVTIVNNLYWTLTAITTLRADGKKSPEKETKMNFAEAMREETTHTFTENGAPARNTSGDKLVDFYSVAGALRNADPNRVTRLFDDAYAEDKLLAAKILFYARDIRGGLGERRLFRIIIKHMAMYHPEALRPNLDLIGVFGRYDDLYELIDTPLENDMWAVMKAQFEEDKIAEANGKATSLLAKWIKTPDTSSKESRRLGCLTAKKLGYSVKDFKKILRKLRRAIGIVESLMSAKQWDKIKYPEVPSRAMKIYKNAFLKHDQERFLDFTQKALTGEVKINSSTLYPYDIIEEVLAYSWSSGFYVGTGNYDIAEAQWRALPNYVKPGSKAIVMADVSGSMEGRPINTSVGLAIYFAERNEGPYKDMFITFSARPHFQSLRGTTLCEKLASINYNDWDSNTDLEAALMLICETAIENNVKPEDMPDALIILTDMEIDRCTRMNRSYVNRITNDDDIIDSWSFYDNVKRYYESHGYNIPNIIFWNVDSRNDVFHTDSKRKGVQLVSGQSTAVFKQLMDNIGLTPYEAMLNVINDDRYSCITVER